MKNKIKAVVIGANGYAGAEVARLLSAHPNVELAALTSRSNKGKKVSEIISGMPNDLVFSDTDDAKIRNADVAFVALPQTAGAALVGELIDCGVRVIDLSADYRFDDVETYQKVYGVVHPRNDLCNIAVCGCAKRRAHKAAVCSRRASTVSAA